MKNYKPPEIRVILFDSVDELKKSGKGFETEISSIEEVFAETDK